MMLLGEIDERTIGLVALAGVVILCFITLRITYRKLREPGTSPKEYAREQVARLKDQHAMKGDMEELLVH